MRSERGARRAVTRALLLGALSLGLLPACAAAPSGTGALSLSGTTHTSQKAPSHTSETGVLRGRLLFVGGPAPGSPRPLSGTIVVTGKLSLMVAVGPDGRYAATVPAGTYRVAGSSPAFGSGQYGCHARSLVRVVPKGTVRADVLCVGS
jgi:hypothetical protein